MTILMKMIMVKMIMSQMLLANVTSPAQRGEDYDADNVNEQNDKYGNDDDNDQNWERKEKYKLCQVDYTNRLGSIINFPSQMSKIYESNMHKHSDRYTSNSRQTSRQPCTKVLN